MFNRFHFLSIGLLISLFLAPSMAVAAYCGDGFLDSDRGEVCDDGNLEDRDGCSAYCRIEDMEPPTVASFSIPAEATDVPTTTTTFTLVFSEPMDPSLIIRSRISLMSKLEAYNADLKLEDDQKTVTIRHLFRYCCHFLCDYRLNNNTHICKLFLFASRFNY